MTGESKVVTEHGTDNVQLSGAEQNDNGEKLEQDNQRKDETGSREESEKSEKESVTETTDLEVKSKLSGKEKEGRFKRIVNSIIAQCVWARHAAKRQKEIREEEGFTTRNKGEEKLTFNLNAFKAHVQTCGKLSNEAIQILKKQGKRRSEEEIKIIQKIVYRLKCFDRYPFYVKQELARVLYYDKFEDKRLIIKQGQPGISFYFIVSGAVVVDRMEIDPRTGEKHFQTVGELNAGDSFGEMALLHNTKRTATIFCKGTSEFLRVDKPDFDEVLRNSHQREWEIRINLLSTHDVFKGWSNKELKVANGHAKMKNYAPNSVIISQHKQRPDQVYFIVSGHCKVVREISLLKKYVAPRKAKYVLPPIDRKQTGAEELQKKSLDRLETRYLTICHLSKGDFFNVGESLDGLYILSVGRVEIIQVGRLAFSRHGDRGKCLEDMQQAYLSRVPDVHQSFSCFVADKRWKCYKKNLVNDVISRRNRINHTQLGDVPGIHAYSQIYHIDDDDIL